VCDFYMLNTRPAIDIIHSPQPFRYVTSAVWYVSQATAECLISCKPRFSSSGEVGAMTHLGSFPCTCTPKGSKWYTKIRLGGEIPHTQRHPNCCAREYLVNCGACGMVPVETRNSLYFL
jgi:hypothetical protein